MRGPSRRSVAAAEPPSSGPLADLVAQARRHGVRDTAVLAAIGQVPRQRFVPRRLASAAFDDGPLPIGEGQTISQPAMVALMAEAARLSPNDRVLEIGTGSGYGAMVLRALASQVLSIERRAALAGKARAALSALGADDVKVVVGDGTLGWPDSAPFDAIVVTAAGPAPPPPLLAQLAPAGRLVMPVGSRGGVQHLMRYTRPAPTASNGGIDDSDGNGGGGNDRNDGDDDRDGNDGGDGNGSDGSDNRGDAVGSRGTLAVQCHAERLMAVRFVALIGAHGFGSGVAARRDPAGGVAAAGH